VSELIITHELYILYFANQAPKRLLFVLIILRPQEQQIVITDFIAIKRENSKHDKLKCRTRKLVINSSIIDIFHRTSCNCTRYASFNRL